MVPSDAEVDRMHDDWAARGVSVEQAPLQAAFGRTFVALDPDGHRLRVCTPDGCRPGPPILEHLPTACVAPGNAGQTEGARPPCGTGSDRTPRR